MSEGADIGKVVIGKDILELLTSAMYTDPLSVYREYVQNAVDSLALAAEGGAAPDRTAPEIGISIDPNTRTIRVRDTGTGIPEDAFVARMTAIGASPKRGTTARGFRGVGRLAGLGFCRELVFRSRAGVGQKVSEIRWDCAKLKAALRSAEYLRGLGQLVRDIVTVGTMTVLPGHPERFFEVEMNGVVRHRNDRLLDAAAVAEYLSQVAPVPFSPEFPFGRDIASFLRRHTDLGDVEIRISGGEQLFRPHRGTFETDENGGTDEFTDVEFIEVPGTDGGASAVAWILHHGYKGAIPGKALVKGLRFRSGNIQVGGHGIMDDLFPEPRFNSWTVGEVHVIDRRIVPNGRRDHYEESVHLGNLLNHLTPVGRDIAKRCRDSSVKRKWLREFELHAAAAEEKMGVLAQGALGDTARKAMVSEVDKTIAPMEKISRMEDLAVEAETILKPKVQELRKELDKVAARKPTDSPLARLPREKREMYEHLFELVYECSTNRVAAKALIDRILVKIL